MTAMLRDSADTRSPSLDRDQQSHERLLFISASVLENDQDVHSPDELNATTELTENKVAIILGRYDGDNHLAEQLQSIFGQSHKALHVFVADDFSQTPFTIDALKLDAGQRNKLSIGIRSKNVGFAKNFLSALADIEPHFEYFAFSDQDDIWHTNKLEKALSALSEVSTDIPALYCARTELVDETCTKTLGYSTVFSKPPSFANALIQSIAGGNTMVFNNAARQLIVASSLNAPVVSHDWWSYQIVTGAGGRVIYDLEPSLKYRQHGNNLIGATNASWAARFLRIRELMLGKFRSWNDINLKALSDHKHLLTEQNRRVLNDFIDARQSRYSNAVKLFKRSGIYRQTMLGNLGLLLGIFLNKV